MSDIDWGFWVMIVAGAGFVIAVGAVMNHALIQREKYIHMLFERERERQRRATK